MSKVGLCRVTTIALVVCYLLFALAYSTYYFAENQLYNSDSEFYVLIYVLPALMLTLYFLIAVAYILCIVIKPLPIPDEYCLSTEELANFMIQPKTAAHFQTVSSLTRQYTRARPGLRVRERDYRHGGLRICEICSIIKPDRAHHCSFCKRCVLVMDHHCLWVNNCIHERNYKFFIQTITFAALLGFLTLSHFGININNQCMSIPAFGDSQYAVCVVMYVGMTVAILMTLFLTFLSLDHCNNLLHGRTSYERVYDRDDYNRGWRRNFLHVMGLSCCEWFCPVIPSPPGEEYEPLIVTVTEPSTVIDPWSGVRGNTISDVKDIEETISIPPSDRPRIPSSMPSEA